MLVAPPYDRDCCSDPNKGPYSHTLLPSFGLGYIAAVLIKDGYDVELIESPLQKLDIKHLKKIILESMPDIIGLTCSTYTFSNAVKIAKIAKESIPEIKTIIGGPHVAFNIENTLMTDVIDFVIVGEGEKVVKNLLNNIENYHDVKGIAFKKGSEIITNPREEFIKDLDILPFPAWHLLPKNVMKSMGGAIITSRGCPFGCIFCASTAFWGSKTRQRSSENVLKELKILIDRYDFKKIDFLDDTFSIDKNRVIEICNGIINSNLDFEWSCNARVDTLDEETLKKMKNANCKEIFFGIESGSQKILDICKKGITISQIKKTVNLANQLGFKVILSFVIGLPGECKETIEETKKLLKEIDGDEILLNPLIPLPGTDLYNNPGKYGIRFLNKDWKDYVQFLVETEKMSVKDLKDAFFELVDIVSEKVNE